jgi:hypothetical protein
MVLLVLVGSIALQAWAWARLRERLRAGSLSKPGAILRYSAWAFAPALGAVAVFFAAVGLEEAGSPPLVAEGLARAAPFVAIALLASAIIGSLLFACGCVLRRSPTLR